MPRTSSLGKIAVMLLCALLATTLHAQFEVYTTLDDLTNGTPQTYPGFEYDSQKGNLGDVKIKLKNDATKEKMEIDCSAIWGFSYRGHLFRIVKYGKYYNEPKAPQHMPVKLMLNKGGAFYWLRAPNLMTYLRKAAEREAAGEATNYPLTFIPELYQGFLSSTVDGDMMVVVGGYFLNTPKWFSESQGEFMKDHPELEWLKTCVMSQDWDDWDEVYSHEIVKMCIMEHVPPAKSPNMRREE